MLWWRMIRVAWRLGWPYVLTPWRSPLLRWRLETFGVLDEQGRLVSASSMTPRLFLRFVGTHPAVIVRFLRWAAQLER